MELGLWKHRLARLIGAAMLVLLATGNAGADQRDPDLDDLFNQLQRVTSDDAAKDVVAEIWQRWTAFDNDPRATNLMAIGIRQMNLGQFGNAERIFSELVRDHPTHAEAWNKRATVRFMRGDDQGSRSDIARVIDLEPRHFGALSGLGMINMRSGDLPAALQAFEAALRVNPHLEQAEAMIRQLRTRLRGRAL
ncbi:MAG: tetratricopeptide repeat protein [Pseudomonadota bacterium]|nr:tetratricopeptide repeat protein [Pseudomonadota bacterium]